MHAGSLKLTFIWCMCVRACVCVYVHVCKGVSGCRCMCVSLCACIWVYLHVEMCMHAHTMRWSYSSLWWRIDYVIIATGCSICKVRCMGDSQIWPLSQCISQWLIFSQCYWMSLNLKARAHNKRREIIQFSQYHVQIHCVKFAM